MRAGGCLFLLGRSPIMGRSLKTGRGHLLFFALLDRPMPQVHDGIGTWYYGKKRILRHKGVCGFCNAVGELVSYDTTLYFVVFMVPLVPLRRKRILEQCPHCSMHRVLPLKQWQT